MPKAALLVSLKQLLYTPGKRFLAVKVVHCIEDIVVLAIRKSGLKCATPSLPIFIEY
jgi:hypothetical protein